MRLEGLGQSGESNPGLSGLQHSASVSSVGPEPLLEGGLVVGGGAQGLSHSKRLRWEQTPPDLLD
jgi:hypothetical protein